MSAVRTFLDTVSEHLEMELSADEVRVQCALCGGLVPADAPLTEDCMDGSHELCCPADGSAVARVYPLVPTRDGSIGGYSMQADVWIRVDGGWITWREATELSRGSGRFG